ncbi:septum formation initiator family protein [Streptomyces sp. RY43-2]|uniref:Septum formation initiator family protein n=1 Tax=Streptomyces macrolidinus TaxID=2952607 RepID=A0ABT0Z8G0_9ACTN|nr:septum formation initiator family protein [Streptomyces macrolidinus]MCN9239790.1 septum formation initiator family protein [Streptomyces macrolidinus]
MSRKPRLRGRAARLARLIPAGGGGAARTPFVLLVVVLLGGGLIGLLVLNSALSEGAFKLSDLQRETKNLTDEEQALQRDVDAYAAPDALRRRADTLGMVPGGDPAFLGPDGTVKGVPRPAAQPSASPASLSAPASPGPSPSTTASPSPSRTASASASPSPSRATPSATGSTPSAAPSPTPGR